MILLQHFQRTGGSSKQEYLHIYNFHIQLKAPRI